MKINQLTSVLSVRILLITLCALSPFIHVSPITSATTDRFSGLTISLQSDKQDYLLGEPISITFNIVNNSRSPIELAGSVDVLAGGIGLRVASEEGPFRIYRGPLWGSVNVKFSKLPTIEPAGSITKTATVLYNRAPKRADLNETYWKRVVNEQIDTEIALAKPGRYRLKAILFGTIESAPLEIRVSEPQTVDDIEVWKVISSEPEYAFFMQSGDLLEGTLTDPGNKEFVDALEKFINYHATSTYTPHFRAAIARYRAALEKVKAATAK
jgi:hypothetical protein